MSNYSRSYSDYLGAGRCCNKNNGPPVPGPPGERGPIGPVGFTGPTGANGSAGATGEPGASPTTLISAGTLTSSDTGIFTFYPSSNNIYC